MEPWEGSNARASWGPKRGPKRAPVLSRWRPSSLKAGGSSCGPLGALLGPSRDPLEALGGLQEGSRTPVAYLTIQFEAFVNYTSPQGLLGPSLACFGAFPGTL